MDKRQIKSIIEGMLYSWGDPLSLDDISAVLEIERGILRSLLEEMKKEFEEEKRGIVLHQRGDAYEFTTREEHHAYIIKLFADKKPRSLSAPALEVLAIIAYKQPVTKVEIDEIRGVKSNSVVDSLKERGFIHAVGRLERIGRPILYGTTVEFLRYFNLESLDDLPDLESFEDQETPQQETQIEIPIE